MKLLGTLIHWIGVLCLIGCASTVVAQIVGVATLASRGMLTSDKLVKYAGVMYGLDPLDFSPPTMPENPGEHGEDAHQKAVADRVAKTPTIAARQAAIHKGTDDIRGVVLGLQIERDHQQKARVDFEAKLKRLDEENRVTGLREIAITVESLPPEQAKDILCTMLANTSDDAADDVMGDVVNVVKGMPGEKLRKVLDEFRTAKERDLLHEILVRLGNLQKVDSQLTGTQP